MTHRNTTLAIFAVPALLLAAAFLGNLFVEGWNWSGFDFLVAAVLLFGTAGLIFLIRTFIKNRNYRILLSLIIIVCLVLIWVELAVGIFGSPFAGN